MKTIIPFFIVLIFLLYSTSYGSQKQANELATIISVPLGYLDKTSVRNIAENYLRNHENIYGIKITELLTDKVYFSMYKNKGILISSRHFPNENKKYALYHSDSIFNHDIVGTVEIYTKSSVHIQLSKKEKEYLRLKKTIKTCIDPNWMPFESLHNGTYIGVSADFINLFSKSLDIPIQNVRTHSWKESLEKIKERECDILPLASKTKKRSRYLNFTTPYIHVPIVIATKIGVPFISSLENIKKKPFGIVEGYSLVTKLQKEYPNIQIIKVSSIQEGLQKVFKGELFGMIDNSISIYNYIQQKYLGNLIISGKLDDTWNLCIATRNDEPELLSIFQKLINNIDKLTYEQILNKWYTTHKSFDYPLLIKIFVSFLIIIIIIFLWLKKLRDINNSLENRIKQAVKENQEKERLLMHKSKLADMGEMIRNIAHQWRQPLATSNMAVSLLKTKNEMGLLEKDYLDKKLNEIENLHLHMSQTIENFLSFFDPHKEQEEFNLLKLIHQTINLLQITLNKKSIRIDITIDKSIYIYGYKDEYAQVVISIITNALQEYKGTQEKSLFLKAYKKGDDIYLEITDNAGGIDESIIDKIFDPYFSTKHQIHGTGLGLYISKVIIEKNMKGILKVQNIDKGAMFTIITKNTRIHK